MGSGLIYSSFLNQERMDLIDNQIESYASILSHSDLIKRDFSELDEAEQQIQKILGGNRIGLVLILRNLNGRVIYKNDNADSLELDPDLNKVWQFSKNDNNTLRIYTKKIPQLDRIIQIGIVMNQQSINEFYGSRIQIFYFILLVIVSSVLSWVLATKLFSPMRLLAKDLNLITKQLDPQKFDSSTWDTSFYGSKNAFFYKNDEFAQLIQSVRNLLEQIRLAFQMNINHSARLAHEVNTPLTVIKNRLSHLESSRDFSIMKKINDDIDHLADFVHQYLEYSESLNTPQGKTEIYAIKLNTFIEQIEQALKPLAQERIQIQGKTNHTVFANYHDLEHVVQNLITNALKYSPKDKDVILNFKEDRITIQDFGDGIPDSVLNKLGSPFNVGVTQDGVRGTGLGLAWIIAISKKYKWKLDFKSQKEHGTEVTLIFP